MLQHSQELSNEVTQAHIKLYVNEFTENIGETGYKAVASLLSRASQEGLVPKVDLTALYM